jgi:hypothetical protein
MNRAIQMGVWFPAGPVLGLVQGITSFLPVVVSHSAAHDVAAGATTCGLISLVYGCYWVLPALLLSDWLFLRRALPLGQLGRYLGIVAICALLFGVFLPGFALMIGYPLTALATIGLAYAHRKRPSAAASA